jgi:very-short-patch-repair endonuclease
VRGAGRAGSSLERALAQQIALAGLPEPEREAVLVPGRKFRVDFYWRAARLVVEADGGIWGKGRHTSGAGFTRDAEKTNLLTLLGYRVLRVTSAQVQSGQALAWITQALADEGTVDERRTPGPS